MRFKEVRLIVDIEGDNFKIKDVKCHIVQAANSRDISCKLLLTVLQCKALSQNNFFSFEGQLRTDDGHNIGTIRASKAHWTSIPVSVSDSEPTELEVMIELSDLYIANIVPGSNSTDLISKVIFELTNNYSVMPSKIIERSFTGNVVVDTRAKYGIQSNGGNYFNFDKYFGYYENESHETVSYPYLVAETNICGINYEAEYINKTLGEDLSSILYLCSFAERKRCVWHSWELSNSHLQIEYSRFDIVLPAQYKRDHLSILIEKSVFKEFMDCIYPEFVLNDNSRMALQSAIDILLNYESYPTSVGFLTLFVALELLTNSLYDKSYSMGDQWDIFCKDLKRWIKNESNLRGEDQEEIRKSIYSKIQELNRPALGDKLHWLLSQFDVHLDDLWPLMGKGDAGTLLSIRNRLVHGAKLDITQQFALGMANLHLQWIIERLMLSVLKWPVSKSNVRAEYLPNYFAYTNWSDKYRILSKKD